MKFFYVVVLTALASDDPSQVVTAEDRTTATEVTAKKEEMCAKVPEESAMDEDEKKSVRSSLEVTAGVDADGMHPVENMLRNYDPKNPPVNADPLAMMGITYGSIVSNIQGALMAVFLMIFFVCCYHQLCCRCIPPKAKDSEGCTKNVKIGFSFCTGALAFAVVIAVVVAPRGELVAGSNRIFCTMGEMADVSMSGVGGDGFPGFLDVCENIANLLTGVLSPPVVDATTGAYTNPGDFVPSARALLSDTASLDRSLAVVLSSIDRLKAISEDPYNVVIDGGDPSICPAGVVCSGHKNLLLSEMGPKLEEVRKGLDSTIAGVLGEVKAGAADFLSDDNLVVLFGTVNDGMLAPLRAVKESFVGSMAEQLTSQGGVPALVEANMSSLESACSSVGGMMFIFAIAAFVCIFLLIKMAPVEGKEGKERFPATNHRCAGCTWFCGWGCTYLICIVSAGVALISWPFSSGCLVMLDLSKESMSNYPMFDSLTELDSAIGIMENCIFPGGNGDMLGAIKMPYNDTRTVPSGEETKIDAREMVTLMIKGAVDKIFEPIENMNTGSDQEMGGMGDLNKFLNLLGNLSSFYTYAHEIDLDPKFPSLTAVVTALDSKAMDYDPRATSDLSCPAGNVSCTALGARVRVGSLGCEDFAVPPGSFDGQPDSLPGMEFVLASINSYPRPSDGSTTQVTCETQDDQSVVVTKAVVPKCTDTDTGMCTAMCDADAVCVSLCTGSITSSDAVAYQAAVAANPAVADGIDSTEHDKYCPPVATLRVLESFVAEHGEKIFTCIDFDCTTGTTLADCAVYDEASKTYSVPTKSKTCTLAELIATMDEAGATLKTAISDVEKAGADFLPTIGTTLKELIYDKMVDPFLKLIDVDTMDCGFLVTAWGKFMEGTCYNLGGAIAQYSRIFTLCAQCGFLLVFLIFGLWRHFIDMYEANLRADVTVSSDK